MIQTSDGSSSAGRFQIGDDWISGELRFEEQGARLHLSHPEFFHFAADDGCVLGELIDADKVSLHGCIHVDGPTQKWTDTGTHYFGDLGPHFVIVGPKWLKPSDDAVSAIRVVVSDAYSLFDDPDAFSLAVAGTAQLEGLFKAHSEAIGRDVEPGPAPFIAFFRGDTQIAEAETVLGKVSVHHRPSGNLGGPRGIRIDNQIWLKISFAEPILFAVAIDRLLVLLRFLELCAGRRQNLLQVAVDQHDAEGSLELNVHWCNPPRREGSGVARDLNWHDLPVDGGRQPAAFSSVLSRWIDHDLARQAARVEFSDVIAQERRYGTVRLVSAANIFDLLPADAVCPEIALDDELIGARDDARARFKKLPQSVERDSVLGALGRIGKPSLKRKIRHRAEIVTGALQTPLPHLEQVLDIAVEARNVFVHGSDSKIDFIENSGRMLPFLTDALQFVFAASDLIDAGWDAAEWERRAGWGHPLGYFLRGYEINLNEFDAALPLNRKLRSLASAEPA